MESIDIVFYERVDTRNGNYFQFAADCIGNGPVERIGYRRLNMQVIADVVADQVIAAVHGGAQLYLLSLHGK